MKSRILHVFLSCIFTCAALCCCAQLLVILRGQTHAFSFSRFLLNYAIAYPLACLAGIFIPSDRFGAWVCHMLKLKTGAVYGIVMNAAVNILFTLVMSSAMTFVNVVVMEGQGWIPFLMGIINNFLPMWLLSCIVSALVRPPLWRVACRITGEDPT